MSKQFQFPPIYNFPPFWTLQEVMETKRRQCEIWGSLILKYTQFHKQTELDLEKALTSDLFTNKTINRKLSKENAIFFLERLVCQQNAEWMNTEKTKIKIIWRKPEDWGSLLLQWAQKNNYTNTVFTFYELREGDDTINEPFHMMDQDIMKKAIQHLDKKKKAKFIQGENFDECGVKFF
ncbi:Vacuolar protein-sorting-associated protein 25 [Histomonas meleagridis]|uniref:Vacuolar protein-sorting-associated protein 25 n=1 Tax=Histomonas meleagridis TaxID=135588 RepID=UPI00355A7180|nr:Vacuolar protein-sorting-associated protein 25 [Histomonas meleagridis]KAH0804385.1 Vacuolar protein-sorting-associated protein 25 [Histomonas meleagridis]